LGNIKNIDMKINTALISVYDKKNLKQLLKLLNGLKVNLISSGGTYKKIRKLGFKCQEISNFTGSSEILEGRVKTLHPKIHAGILSKRNNKLHNKQLKKNKYKEIDLVVVNFYPFEETLKKTKNHTKIIENIDIGGPAMARAAAKNYKFVTVISNPNQYNKLIHELKKNNGKTSENFRKQLSLEAFLETGCYDSSVSNYFCRNSNNYFTKKKIFHGNLIENLRYGENPHQKGAIYSSKNEENINQIGGKKLSYNNLNDIYSAILISKSLPNNLGTVIIKHSNPCGVSIDKNKLLSLKNAISCDPVSAYGGIISFNFKINKKIALELNKIFIEVIISKGFEKDAIRILKKRKNLRIIDSKHMNFNNEINTSQIFNSILLQEADIKKFTKSNFKVVSKKQPTQKLFNNLIFAFNVCRFAKSNAIVLAKDNSIIGIGSGQPSRLDSCKIAIDKMRKFQKINYEDEIVAASDAFFPFVDGVETLVQSGVKAIIQPSGSIRDKEIIKFANDTGTILIFSKTRHFKH
tara:strand:+ start:2786 stop:4348 length:1563 start_codon:yes stop_codon:yes gene_type:complete